MGAWIETRGNKPLLDSHGVAPYVGAWIETDLQGRSGQILGESHPTWVRGLKLFGQCQREVAEGSHPTWVRGLKPDKFRTRIRRWLSHPTWVRGLKRERNVEFQPHQCCRTLRGCVD